MLSNHPTVRLVLYVFAVLCQVASFFCPVFAPDLAVPFSQTADFIGVAVIGVAITNRAPSTPEG